VHVAADRKNDFFPECRRVFEQAAEHRVAVVAPLHPPVAAEGGEWLSPESGWPNVAQQQQPIRRALFHMPSQQRLRIVAAVHPS
jgi:hypothetical protein